MKTKFEDFLKESILPELVQMDYDEDARVRLNADEIEIDDEFENELSDRKTWELKQWSSGKAYDQRELIKLNLYFGIHIEKLYEPSVYVFKTEFGTFGQPITKLKGTINKRREYDDKGKEFINTFYLLDMHMTVKVGPNKGNRHVFLKFDTLDQVIDFFKSFER